MNDAYSLAQAWISFVAIGLIYGLIIRRQRLEQCRSDLRIVRDDLFDFMWQNGYDFSTPAYREVRQSINGMMRLTNVLGPFLFCALIVRCENDPKHRRAIDDLPDGQLKQKLQAASHDAWNVFVTCIFQRGVFGCCATCLWVTFRAFEMIQRLRQWLQGKSAVLAEMTLEYGRPDLSPEQKSLLWRGASLRW